MSANEYPENLIELLNELNTLRKRLGRVNDIVVRTVVIPEDERDYESAFSELLDVVASGED